MKPTFDAKSACSNAWIRFLDCCWSPEFHIHQDWTNLERPPLSPECQRKCLCRTQVTSCYFTVSHVYIRYMRSTIFNLIMTKHHHEQSAILIPTSVISFNLTPHLPPPWPRPSLAWYPSRSRVGRKDISVPASTETSGSDSPAGGTARGGM